MHAISSYGFNDKFWRRRERHVFKASTRPILLCAILVFTYNTAGIAKYKICTVNYGVWTKKKNQRKCSRQIKNKGTWYNGKIIHWIILIRKPLAHFGVDLFGFIARQLLSKAGYRNGNAMFATRISVVTTVVNAVVISLFNDLFSVTGHARRLLRRLYLKCTLENNRNNYWGHFQLKKMK